MIANVPFEGQLLTINYWRADRLVLHVTSSSAIELYTLPSTLLATYTPPTAGVIDVDLTDYVRAFGSTSANVLLGVKIGSTTYPVTVVTKGLINPDNVLIPAHGDVATIIPPEHMIMGEPGQVIAEWFKTIGANYTTANYVQSVNNGRGLKPTGQTASQNNFAVIRTTPSPSASKNYYLSAQECSKQYAIVDWVSFTGAQRRHIFEVVKAKTDAVAGYNLLPIDNEYVEIKGRVDGFTLRLDGLTAYDMWYYADMVTSSKVEVSLDGTNYDRVQVSTKTFTLPDGENNDGKLEINVNWKRYDAVAM